jgi:two-component system, LytTR family, sensor kinase
MKLKHHILLHSVFWLLFLGLPITSSAISEMGHPGLFEYLFTFGLMNILNFYTCFFFINKNVMKDTQSLRYLWWLLPVLIIFTTLRFYAGQVLDHYYAKPEDQQVMWYIDVIGYFVTTMVYTVISLLITFFVGWIKAQKQKDELEKQSQQAEIALLRSQINPHFLFNTLNNLYSLVYRKSDEAPGALMKLSDILRYMLYESNTDKVYLEKEITYIRSYIELQQLRINTPNFIDFELKGNIEGKLIPPMLLITFIENAFKHGSKSVEAPGIIIHIDCEGQGFVFKIKSYIADTEPMTKDPQKGIGTQNVKRRLELTYPGKHELIAGIYENTYQVKLILKEL